VYPLAERVGLLHRALGRAGDDFAAAVALAGQCHALGTAPAGWGIGGQCTVKNTSPTLPSAATPSSTERPPPVRTTISAPKGRPDRKMCHLYVRLLFWGIDPIEWVMPPQTITVGWLTP